MKIRIKPEVWKPIPGYSKYEVSDRGRVRRLYMRQDLAPRILKPFKHRTGYMVIDLTGRKSVSVHRLVLLAFIGPCPEDHEAMHKNSIRDDNRLSNLKWGTLKENQQQRQKEKPTSEEQKQRLRSLCIGRKQPREEVERRAASNRGRQRSAEVRERMRKGREEAEKLRLEEPFLLANLKWQVMTQEDYYGQNFVC